MSEEVRIDYIEPEQRYSNAVIRNGIIYTAGQVPENPNGDIRAQTRDVLAQIDALLEKCRSNKSAILEATIYLKDMNDYAEMNAVWDTWVVPNKAPARACVQAHLAHPDWKIEIKLTAIVLPPPKPWHGGIRHDRDNK